MPLEQEQNLNTISEFLAFSPTEDQEDAIRTFLEFIEDSSENTILILRGAAGTGKSSLLSALSKWLRKNHFHIVMMAPTGRAAKVLYEKTNCFSSTVHRQIYQSSELANGTIKFRRAKNEDNTKSVYFIDEASMINDLPGSGSSHFEQTKLLEDLIAYVLEDNPKRKILLVGDQFQLPPVGAKSSPALHKKYLEQTYNLKVYRVQISEIKRQLLDSGILALADILKSQILRKKLTANVFNNIYDDVVILEDNFQTVQTYVDNFNPNNSNKIILITYSNYNAVQFNQQIRSLLHNFDPRIMSEREFMMPTIGDFVMITRNNYRWGGAELPFIANGEMAKVARVYPETFEEKFGLKWLDLELEFDLPNGKQHTVYGKVILNLLDSKDANLPFVKAQEIYLGRKNDYIHEGYSAKKTKSLLRKDEYVNALQIKYGYAVTGHKSQGGEWENVIVAFEPIYNNLDAVSYLRWSYTAITRASKKLYLLNCPFVQE